MSSIKRRSLHNIDVPNQTSGDSISDWNMGCASGQETFMPSEVRHANIKMDQFFDNQGLFRYHLPVDGSCLFRAVSDVLFGCQNKHPVIREKCCDFILNNKKTLTKDFDRNQNIEEYVERLQDLQYPGGNLEMHVLSKIYKVDFLVYYRPEAAPVAVTHGRHEKKISLCWAHNKQYDLVYTKQHIEALRMTQAIVYDVLYKRVFELGSNEVDFAVNQMLYQKDNFKNKRHLTFTQWCNSVLEGEEQNVTSLPENKGEQIVLSVRCGVPPFPFKVAKCLDPKILRNVDFLNWCEENRDAFRSGNLVTPALDTGVKCTARIGMKEHTGFVQSIDRKTECAQVFLQSIGEIRTIPLTHIESSPIKRSEQSGREEEDYPKLKPLTSTPMKNRRSLSTGDAITNDQSKALGESFHHLTKSKEKMLRGIPETSDIKTRAHDEPFRETRKYGRKHSLPVSHVPPISTAAATSFVPTSSPITMMSASMSPLIVDPTCHYHMTIPPTTEGTLYSPPAHYLRPAAEPYPLVGTVPVVPLAQFNPSVPPPTFQSIQNGMEPAEEMIEFGFSFPGPPAGLDVSSVVKSERSDGFDLPRVDVLRYFFNLGVSVYRLRKNIENTIMDDTLLQAPPQNPSYPMPSQIPGYSLVPQHSLVYQPNFQQFYSLVPPQAQGSFSEVPTFQVGPVLANK